MSYVTRSQWCGLVLQSDKKAGIHLKLVMVSCVTFRSNLILILGEIIHGCMKRKGEVGWVSITTSENVAAIVTDTLSNMI